MKPEEAVVVDTEAGTEHLGRGTAEHVDAMLVVTEPGVASLETARRISKLANEAGIPRLFLIGNRATEDDSKAIRSLSESLRVPIIGIIPYDERLRQLDKQGQDQHASLNSSPGFAAIREVSERLRQEIG
jgi:CO dehydrogenase maturation factor